MDTSSIIPEEITYDNGITNKAYRVAYDKIKVTSYAKQQAYIRFGIQSEVEIQKLAAKAKRNGILVNNLTEKNYKEFKLDYEHYCFLMAKSGCTPYSPDNVYFYKGYFYIFCGSKFRTLKAIVYPGIGGKNNTPTTDEVVEKFFSSFTDTRFRNLTYSKGNSRRSKKVVY